MIISNSKKFIYIHLHKTAGSSIERAIDPYLCWNDIILGSTEYGENIQSFYHKRFSLNKHSNAQECFDVVGESVWDSYFTFSTVRNPYSLVVSTYTFARKMMDRVVELGQYGKSEIQHLRTMGQLPAKCTLSKLFGHITGRSSEKNRSKEEEILRWPIVKAILESGYPDASFDKYLQTSHVWEGLALKPQLEKLTISQHGKKQVLFDKIIKVEELDMAWTSLCKEIGIKAELEHANKSSGRPWQDFYSSAESIERVNAVFKADFDFFGYEFL